MDVLGGKSMDQWLAERTAIIHSGKLSMDRPSPLLRSYHLPNGMPANLFWSLPDSQIRRLEAYRQVGNDVLILGTDGLPDELPVSERLTLSVAASFQQTVPGSGATPGGFGVDGGVVQRPFDNNEFAEADVRFEDGQNKDPADLKVSINTHVYADVGQSTLPARVRRAQEAMLAMKLSLPTAHSDILRNGKRTVAGLAGQEFFVFTHKSGSSPDLGVHAEFEFGGDASNELRPYLQISMDADDLPPGANGAQLLHVWDDLLNSAELRR